MLDYTKKIKVVYQKDEKELIDFLNYYKIKGFEVMICHYCILVFDKEATKSLESIKLQQIKKNN